MNKEVYQIMTEETLQFYVNKIIERGGTPTITQGTSMQPVIEPNELVYTQPLDRSYLIVGSIYAFKEGKTLIIKRLVEIVENTVQHGMKGTNYIFEGDNRETSIDKKVFVSNHDSIRNVFQKVVLYPKLPVADTIIKQLQGGNCMSNEQKLNEPKLSAETMQTIMSNPELLAFIQDIRAVSHNNALRTYEMSCILDGILNFLKVSGLTNIDQMFNFINISTNMKEWAVTTGERIQSFEQFFERFYPHLTLEDLKTGKHKLDIRAKIDEYLKQKPIN